MRSTWLNRRSPILRTYHKKSPKTSTFRLKSPTTSTKMYENHYKILIRGGVLHLTILRFKRQTRMFAMGTIRSTRPSGVKAIGECFPWFSCWAVRSRSSCSTFTNNYTKPLRIIKMIFYRPKQTCAKWKDKAAGLQINPKNVQPLLSVL